MTPSEDKVSALRGCFGGVLQVDVDGFVAGDGGDVGIDIPVEGGWEQLSGLGQELLQVSGVVDIAGMQGPGSAEPGGQAVVDAAKFQASHVVERILADDEVVEDGSSDVVEFGAHLDCGQDISA